MEILTSVKRLYISFKYPVNDFVYSFGRAALLLLVEVQNHTVPVRERGRIRVKSNLVNSVQRSDKRKNEKLLNDMSIIYFQQAALYYKEGYEREKNFIFFQYIIQKNVCVNVVNLLKNSLFTKRPSIVSLILFPANLNGKGNEIFEYNQSVKPTGSNVLSAYNFTNHSDVTRK